METSSLSQQIEHAKLRHFHSHAPDLNEGQHQIVVVPTQSGATLECMIHASKVPWKAVLMLSGSGGGKFGPGEIFNPLGDKLAKELMIMGLRPDFRHPDDPNECRADIESTIEMLKNEYPQVCSSSKKLAVVGWGHGGTIAAIQAAQQFKDYIDIVAVAPTTWATTNKILDSLIGVPSEQQQQQQQKTISEPLLQDMPMLWIQNFSILWETDQPGLVFDWNRLWSLSSSLQLAAVPDSGDRVATDQAITRLLYDFIGASQQLVAPRKEERSIASGKIETEEKMRSDHFYNVAQVESDLRKTLADTLDELNRVRSRNDELEKQLEEAKAAIDALNQERSRVGPPLQPPETHQPAEPAHQTITTRIKRSVANIDYRVMILAFICATLIISSLMTKLVC